MSEAYYPEDGIEKVAVDVTVEATKNTPVEVASGVDVVVSTVIQIGLKEVPMMLGLDMISESSLTEDQKKLASNIYNTTKAAIEDFIKDVNVNSTIKITRTIGQIIKQLENTRLDGKMPTGEDKKAVALQLGRILIKEVTPDDKGEAEILMVYDIVAEPTLEAMIEVSKVVNVAVQELATKCCPGLLELFKHSK
jgi:hypothetical protein